jgi:hypothetical protein
MLPKFPVEEFSAWWVALSQEERQEFIETLVRLEVDHEAR